MTDQMCALHLHAGRTIVPRPAVDSTAQLLAYIGTYGVTFIEIGPQLEWCPDGQPQYEAYTPTPFCRWSSNCAPSGG